VSESSSSDGPSAKRPRVSFASNFRHIRLHLPRSLRQTSPSDASRLEYELRTQLQRLFGRVVSVSAGPDLAWAQFDLQQSRDDAVWEGWMEISWNGVKYDVQLRY